MLYSCTHMATVGVTGLNTVDILLLPGSPVIVFLSELMLCKLPLGHVQWGIKYRLVLQFVSECHLMVKCEWTYFDFESIQVSLQMLLLIVFMKEIKHCNEMKNSFSMNNCVTVSWDWLSKSTGPIHCIELTVAAAALCVIVRHCIVVHMFHWAHNDILCIFLDWSTIFDCVLCTGGGLIVGSVLLLGQY